MLYRSVDFESVFCSNIGLNYIKGASNALSTTSTYSSNNVRTGQKLKANMHDNNVNNDSTNIMMFSRCNVYH